MVSRELSDAIRASVPESHRSDAIGQMRALIQRVEQCLALDPDDVIPVAQHRSLWELRLNDQAFGIHVRVYIAEMPELPHDIVALHSHAKFVDGDDEEIRAKQGAAIGVAIDRWTRGRNTRWGLP